MKQLKHIGRLKNTGAKVLVVFRTLPGESNSALVLPVAGLSDSYHDSLIELVETSQAQDVFEFGEIMHIRHFSDGRPMLVCMQQTGRLSKVATDNVIMTPTVSDTVPLDKLNLLIAEQRNCTVDELYTFVAGAPKKANVTSAQDLQNQPNVDSDVPAAVRAQASSSEPLSDKDLAKSYRSQADGMYKEAARLRKEADLLDPPQKKITTKVPEVASA